MGGLTQVRSRPAVRRLLAAVGLTVALIAFVTPTDKAISDTRFVTSEFARVIHRDQYNRLVCLRDELRALPKVPTYIEPVILLPNLEWYHRAIQVTFHELPLVAERAEAQQVVRVLEVPGLETPCPPLQIQVFQP